MCLPKNFPHKHPETSCRATDDNDDGDEKEDVCDPFAKVSGRYLSTGGDENVIV